MLLKILGWFWIITGVIFLINPEKCREAIKKKSVKKLKKIFFGITLGLSLFLIKATWGMEGIFSKLFLVFGLIGMVKAFFFS